MIIVRRTDIAQKVLALQPRPLHFPPPCVCHARWTGVRTNPGIPMSDTPRQRGRPKGTGINDAATLATLAAMLRANSGLKPTSAIRRLGITDPSIVRRLRDKLKSIPASAVIAQPPPALTRLNLARTTTRRRAPAGPKPHRPTPSTRPARGPLPQDNGPFFSTGSPDPALEPAGSSPATAPPNSVSTPPLAPIRAPEIARQETPAPDPQLEALRLAAEAAAAVSRFYLHCVTFAAQTNPLSLALRSQTIMSQWLATILAAQPPPGKPK